MVIEYAYQAEVVGYCALSAVRTWGVGGRRGYLAVQYSLRTSRIIVWFFVSASRGGAFLFYQEAIEYIKNIERAGSDYGLERMRELLSLLGNPDDKLKFVHVAGTNGKGSVTAYLTSALKEAGYKVGTYNSPSVFCYNERWLINGKPLCDDDVAKYMTMVKECIESERALRKAFGLSDFNPTAFEIETAVAMLAFYDKECDVCVLEVGLGGRWDATNAISQKELAVITPIGLDHCAILGNTLSQIASEKAAIIKDDCVTCEQSDDVMNEIYHPYVFDENGKKIDIKSNVILCKRARLLQENSDGQTFEYGGKTYRISMLGAHQLVNASIAICALETLRKKHFDISDEAIAKGLEKTVWHARFEVVKNAKEKFNVSIPQDKVLVFDGAHNPHGAVTLANSVCDYFKDKRVHLVFGMLKDKDVEGVCALICPLAKRVSCVTPTSPRALDKSDLKKVASKYCEKCDEQESVKSAVQNALDGDCDVVVLCGSLTLFADMEK